MTFVAHLAFKFNMAMYLTYLLFMTICSNACLKERSGSIEGDLFEVNGSIEDKALDEVYSQGALDSIIPLKSIDVNGEKVDVFLTGDFFWESSHFPQSTIEEKYPGILVYNLSKQEEKPLNSSFYQKDRESAYELVSYDRVEFYNNKKKLLKVVSVDSILLKEFRSSSIKMYKVFNFEASLYSGDNIKELEPAYLWRNNYVTVYNNGFVGIVGVYHFITSECYCPYKSKVIYVVFDRKGNLVFEKEFLNKSLYETSMTKDGEFIGVSWDNMILGTELENEEIRGVDFYLTSASERSSKLIYSDSLLSNKGVITRTLVSQDGYHFDYNIDSPRRSDKNEHFSRYLIVDPKGKKVYFRDFTHTEWKQLEKYDWRKPYPSGFIKEFNFLTKEIK